MTRLVVIVALLVVVLLVRARRCVDLGAHVEYEQPWRDPYTDNLEDVWIVLARGER